MEITLEINNYDNRQNRCNIQRSMQFSLGALVLFTNVLCTDQTVRVFRVIFSSYLANRRLVGGLFHCTIFSTLPLNQLRNFS